MVAFTEARTKANEVGLDLVAVAPEAKPPVIRVMDFGKLRYEQKKKLKDQRKHQHANKVKEVKFRVSIDQHDYDYKVNHAIEFLSKGYKVKITLMFRGREMAHKDMGFVLIEKVTEALKEHGFAENKPKLMGRNISVNFAPLGNHHH